MCVKVEDAVRFLSHKKILNTVNISTEVAGSMTAFPLFGRSVSGPGWTGVGWSILIVIRSCFKCLLLCASDLRETMMTRIEMEHYRLKVFAENRDIVALLRMQNMNRKHL